MSHTQYEGCIEACNECVTVCEHCAASCLPGVKVNEGAVGRIIQLTQEGYVQIQP